MINNCFKQLQTKRFDNILNVHLLTIVNVWFCMTPKTSIIITVTKVTELHLTVTNEDPPDVCDSSSSSLCATYNLITLSKLSMQD